MTARHRTVPSPAPVQPTPTGPEPEIAEAAREVRESVVRLARRLRRHPQEHGVSNLGVSVLARLQRHRALTPRALSDGEHVAPQTLTRVLASLEEQGMVTRREDPTDGRRVLLELTPSGREVLRRDAERRERWLSEAMATELTPAELRILRVAAELLGRLADT